MTAIAKAREDVRLSRFGDGWKVMVYSVKHRAWYEGNPTWWARARAEYLEARLQVALEHLGMSAEDAAYLATRYGGSEGAGSLRERIKAALAH